MSNENKLVTRDEWLAYMEIGSEYHLIGEGFTSFSESKNPKEYSRHYVHERSERTDTTGFSPSIAYSCDVYTIAELAAGGEVFEGLHPMVEGNAVGGIVPEVGENVVVAALAHLGGGKVEGVGLHYRDLLPCFP